MKTSSFVCQKGLTCLEVEGEKLPLTVANGKTCSSPSLSFKSWLGLQQPRELARNLTGIFQGSVGNKSHRGGL